MNKSRVIKRRPSLKTRWVQKAGMKEKSLNLAHPVVKASYTWSVISDQLEDVLGPTVHHQWFKSARPLVISHNVLIIEVADHFSAQWIHTHFQELIDLLISLMDKRLSSFFISQSERHEAAKMYYENLPESTASEINRKHEDE